MAKKKSKSSKNKFVVPRSVLKKERALDKKFVRESDNFQKKILEKEKVLDKKISQQVDKMQKNIMKKELSIDRHVSVDAEKVPKVVLKKELSIDKKISRQFSKREKKLDALPEDERKLRECVAAGCEDIKKIRDEVSRVVLGQERVVDSLIRGFLANGHVLIEGVPGIAKTLLIRTLANASGCKFSRIQFTVDLLPTDIVGMTTYNQHNGKFDVVKGPIFANFVIADEINRAPPKTQSAMLEAMQEKQVTIGRNTHQLDQPFFVMANNNPLESSGTYPLPEAQVDRFLFKVKMGYASEEEEEKIIDHNVTINRFESMEVQPIINASKILKMQKVTKDIRASDKIRKYIVRIVSATRKPKEYGIRSGRYIEWGCSPRASIGLMIAAKADAFMSGSYYVKPQNVKNVAHDVLRHRLILNYLGQAEKVDSDQIIDEILEKVPLP